MSQENNFIPSQEPYKPLSAFHLFVKSNFPFIENTYEALDNYGLYCKVVEYLNNVISNENAVESNVTDLYNAFVSLNTYVSDYFDNLDVQEEINNKLDDMVESGEFDELLGVYIDTVIQPQLDNISSMVGSLASGSPSGVYTTVSDLTTADPDHTKIYVVTDTGNWYYYNTSSNQWTSGGTYQATKISNDSINKYMLDNNLKNDVYENFGTPNLFKFNYEITHFGIGGTTVNQSSQLYTMVVPIEGGCSYRIMENIYSTVRFIIATTADYPEVGATIIDKSTTHNLDNFIHKRYGYITTSDTANYLLFYFYASGDSMNYTELVDSLSCEKIEDYSKNYSYGVYNEDKTDNLRNDIENAICYDKGTKNLINPYDENIYLNVIPSAQTEYYATIPDYYCSFLLPLEEDTTYTIKRSQLLSRFSYSLCNEYPFANFTKFYSKTDNHNGDTLVINNTTYKYAVIYIYNGDNGITFEDAMKTITVFEGTTYIEPSYVFDNLLGSKYINLVKDKPLGVLEKGYIAISSDDGRHELVSKTIPIFLGYKTTYNKNIPLTMGLMQSSEIFTDNDEKASVLSFIENTGSSVAIHGSVSYPSYTQTELYEFLDSQVEYLTNNLVAPNSIIYPYHDYNTLSSVISGSYYGVCCTGGTNTPITYGEDSKLAGPRSNMYTLYRFSLFNAQMTNQKIKDAIDYAYDHNMIFLPFFHDIDLEEDYSRCKALLDYCVSYANQKGLTFINVGDIPSII